MEETNVIYSNSFRIATGPFEIQLSFRVETPIVNEEDGSIKDVKTCQVADIRLNPAMAKNLSLALQQQVEEFEKQYGKVVDSLILPETGNE